jgi:excisionase family DNA binding protein
MDIHTQDNDENNIKPSREVSLPGTEPLWTVVEVASYLRLEPETIRSMARRGDLPCLKLGKRVWRFKPSDVKNWLNIRQDD